jgi:hypothetical protein
MTKRYASYDERLNAVLEETRKELNLDTLESRNSDTLDFRELAVWEIKGVLVEAFNRGAEYGIAVTKQSNRIK